MPFARCTNRAAERLIRRLPTISFVPPNHARIHVNREPVAGPPPVLHCPGEIEEAGAGGVSEVPGRSDTESGETLMIRVRADSMSALVAGQGGHGVRPYDALMNHPDFV
jgi:hypothetical protein